jgi:hypothetical protein
MKTEPRPYYIGDASRDFAQVGRAFFASEEECAAEIVERFGAAALNDSHVIMSEHEGDEEVLYMEHMRNPDYRGEIMGWRE